MADKKKRQQRGYRAGGTASSVLSSATPIHPSATSIRPTRSDDSDSSDQNERSDLSCETYISPRIYFGSKGLTHIREQLGAEERGLPESSLKFQSQEMQRQTGLLFDNDSEGLIKDPEEEKNLKKKRNKEIQKRAIKKRYAANKRKSIKLGKAESGSKAAEGAEGIVSKLREKVQEFAKDHKVLFILLLLLGFLVFFVVAAMTTCSAAVINSQSVLLGSSYLADDEDILSAEDLYLELEASLQEQIEGMEETHPDFDDYQYQIDEISHDPYALISYLTVMYGEFEISDVEDAIEDLFSLQYNLYVWEETETRTREVTREEERTVRDPRTGRNVTQTIEVTETEEYEATILNIRLNNRGLEPVIFGELDEDEVERFRLLQSTLGNRPDLFPGRPVQPSISYDIPPEAMDDERFANMINEAEKYLGFPYVFGGSTPSSSFDCSGFVCWVINNCGNGWYVGRLTADGLLSEVTYVAPSDAQPGDLIFFEHTYNCEGASHVGIYVGNGMMIHAGSPIQYSSCTTSYWNEHFLCFGRLP